MCLLQKRGPGQGKPSLSCACITFWEKLSSLPDLRHYKINCSRDLPTIIEALDYDGTTALLKGRSNYLCLERLDQQMLSGGDLEAEVLADVMHVRQWSMQTEDGDIIAVIVWRKIAKYGHW